MNIILRNLPESSRENVTNKVNSVIKDRLKLSNISVVSAERKESKVGRFPGVVVAICRSTEEKRGILSSKKRLKDTKNFSRVYISSDKTLQQRIFESNMRVLAESVGDNELTGGRIHRTRGDGYYRQHHAYRGTTDWVDRSRSTPRESDERHQERDDSPRAHRSVNQQTRPRDLYRSSNQRERGHNGERRITGRRDRSRSPSSRVSARVNR